MDVVHELPVHRERWNLSMMQTSYYANHLAKLDEKLVGIVRQTHHAQQGDDARRLDQCR
jgi:hypothetical protein